MRLLVAAKAAFLLPASKKPLIVVGALLAVVGGAGAATLATQDTVTATITVPYTVGTETGQVVVSKEIQVPTVTQTVTETVTVTTPAPPPPPPEPTGFEIPAFDVVLAAGPGVGSNQRIGWWRQYETDHNSWVHNGEDRIPHMVTPAPGQRTISGPRSWVWWQCGSITIPENAPSVGRNFTVINPHNSSYDVGPSGQGIGWAFGSGVTNVRVSYTDDGYTGGVGPNKLVLNINPSPSANYLIVENVEKGKRYDLCIETILGRMDQELGLAGPGVSGGGIGDHPNNGYGRVRVYVDGALAVDTGNRNTLQRAKAPDGKTYTQTMMHRTWDGAYVNQGLPREFTIGRTLTRVGTSLADALTDDPPHNLRSEFGEGGGSFTDLTPLDSTDFRAPQ